jgi:hypothetical protein
MRMLPEALEHELTTRQLGRSWDGGADGAVFNDRLRRAALQDVRGALAMGFNLQLLTGGRTNQVRRGKFSGAAFVRLLARDRAVHAVGHKFALMPIVACG